MIRGIADFDVRNLGGGDQDRTILDIGQVECLVPRDRFIGEGDDLRGLKVGLKM